MRKWPRTDDADGLVEEDVDGDDRILTMRLVDPNGAWKVSDADARLMVPRRPDDPLDGTYFRLLPEGTIRNYDGVLVRGAPERRSLDLNRNFPAGWRTHGEQAGAPYPVSEPEVRTLVDAVVARPNICAYFAYHTYSAVNLRPYDDRPDDKMPIGDLGRYKQLGEWGVELTGYKAASVWHDFRYGRDDVITGAGDTWAYDHLGIYGWTTEFWSPLRAAGITDYHYIEWFEDHPIEHDVTLLQWADSVLGDRGFVPWYAFDHPQLGAVELGGWDFFHTWSNPPPELLHDEVRPHADFAILHALASPRLVLHSVDVAARRR